MGKIFSRIKPLVKRVVTAMVQKQVENAITKVKRGIEKELFGMAMDVTNRPFQNSNLRRQFPNINELPNHRALNSLQKERLEKKKKRKKERLEEVKEGKNLIEVAGKETLAQAEDAVLSLAETSLGLMNDMADLAMATVAEAVQLARGIFETYIRVFSDLGTHGDKVVENSVDLVKTMVAAAPAIVGTCALGPTVTPGALPQFIFAVKSKSDALGTELSKFKSSLSEARGLIENLGPDFPMRDEILDVLEFADTLTIGPQALILTTGGLICLLEVDVESLAVTALESIVGDMAGPLIALATNKASLCDNWRLISSVEDTLTDEELLEYELDWSKHTWDNCRNFQAVEFEVETDDIGVPKTENGKVVYKVDAFNNRIPSKKGCENCKRYKKNEGKAKEEEEKGDS